ncbi:putative membrane protein YphA (DoxX/SURF4 family) [Rhizobium aquaticum]|uniref:Membrane protein YphA (DoxX/SURF4 family) n=1 Tax=Rhizobium aquaticum TaxID=1549636 RepID=A0ABV2IY28_9HYPH
MTLFGFPDPGLIKDSVWKTAVLVLLCSAYIQGPVVKILDFRSAVEEMKRYKLSPAPVFAVTVIIFELTSSAMVISGYLRWAAALALAAFTLLSTLIVLRFWELPRGAARSAAMNGFFEHLGLAAAFVLVALESVPASLIHRV